MHQELTRQYVPTSINSAMIIVVISKQPSVMPLLDHYESYWRLIIGLQGCTGLYDRLDRAVRKKKARTIIG
jgi:hypothetical protein